MNNFTIPEFMTKENITKAEQDRIDRLNRKEVTEPKELKIPEFMYETGTYKEDKPEFEKPVIIVNEEHLKKVLEARKKYLEEKGE